MGVVSPDTGSHAPGSRVTVQGDDAGSRPIPKQDASSQDPLVLAPTPHESIGWADASKVSSVCE